MPFCDVETWRGVVKVKVKEFVQDEEDELGLDTDSLL
jgi:hypothetical protein